MIKVPIRDSERSLNQVDNQWLHEQIDRRRAAGVPVCVRVFINSADLNIILASAGCVSSRSGRHPNQRDAKILSLWEHFNLNREDFGINHLTEFLRQVS